MEMTGGKWYGKWKKVVEMEAGALKQKKQDFGDADA